MSKVREGGFLVARIHQLSGRVFARKLQEHGVGVMNPSQGRILFVLWQEDDLAAGELAAKVSLGPSTLTSALDRLERSGHVVRSSAVGDRRQVRVSLGPTGLAERSAYQAVSSEMLGLFYRGLTERQIDQFESALRKILANLEAGD